MRKIHVVGAVAVAALMAAYGATQWASSRATIEVDALFAGLRATGAKVSYDPAKVDVTARAVSINRIVITPPNDPNSSLTIGKVDVEGIDPSNRRGAAQRVVLHDITVSSTFTNGQETAPVSVKVPKATLTGLEFAAPQADAAAASGDAIVQAIATFATVKAKSVEMPTLTFKMPMTVPAKGGAGVAKADVDYTYSDVKLDSIDDGRIGRATASKLNIASGFPAFAFNAGGENLEVNELDVLPIFEQGLARRKADGKFHKIQGKFAIGRYDATLPDGAVVSMGRSSGDGMWIDPSKVSYRTISSLMKEAQALGPNAAKDQSLALIARVGDIYEGLRMGPIELKDMRTKGAGNKQSDIAIGRIAMTGIEQGKLKQMRMENLTGAAPNARGVVENFAIGLASIDGVDFGGLMKLGSDPALTSGAPPTNLMISKIFGMVQGFELAGMTFVDPKSGKPAEIQQIKASWGQFVNAVPTSIDTVMKMKVPVDPADPRMAPFAAVGMDSVDIAFSAKTSYDQPKKMFSLAPYAIDLGRMGTFTGALTLNNVPETAFSVAPGESLAALQAMELGGLELSLKDTGALAMAQKLAGPDVGLMAAQGLRQQVMVGGKPVPPAVDAMLQSFSRFMTSPGQTLTFKIKPKRKGNLGEMLMLGAMGGPAGIFDVIDVAADVRR